MPPRARIALLDVNVLVALAWPNHVHHSAAQRWFTRHHGSGWATTPVTETGFVRISSNRSAIATATTPVLAMQLLRSMTNLAGHVFWPDAVEVVDDQLGDGDLITHHKLVTDAHLLALAQHRQGRLVTFDSGIARLLGSREPELLDVLGTT